jgi:hypothetical protein
VSLARSRWAQGSPQFGPGLRLDDLGIGVRTDEALAMEAGANSETVVHAQALAKLATWLVLVLS